MKTIKKTLLVLLIFSILPLSVFAEDEDVILLNNPNEVYIGYGYPKSVGTSFLGGFTTIFTTIFTGGLTTQSVEGPGVAQIGYNRFLNENFAVGGIFTFEPHTVTNKTENETTVTNQGTFSIQAKAKVQYGWSRVKLYHALSMGVSFISDYKTPPVTSFIMDIVPIGVKVGIAKGFNAYADVGLWSTALVNAGVSYDF